jgi:hypothetical protein
MDLHPYRGRWRPDVTEPEGSDTHRSVAIGRDDASTKVYRLNSLGYRGEEFDPEASLKLFVCGCSNTFGLGVELEESWPFLFKQKLAQQRGLPESSVNLMNFAEIGASNDYISRTLIEQSARVRPDLIVAAFTYWNRFELLDRAQSVGYGPWRVEQDVPDDLTKRAKYLLLGTDTSQEKIRLIRNVLLLQYFCQNKDIPFVFLFVQPLARSDLFAALAPLFEEADLASSTSIAPYILTVDRAVDGTHPGPRAHGLVAEAAWRTFCVRYG